MNDWMAFQSVFFASVLFVSVLMEGIFVSLVLFKERIARVIFMQWSARLLAIAFCVPGALFLLQFCVSMINLDRDFSGGTPLWMMLLGFAAVFIGGGAGVASVTCFMLSLVPNRIETGIRSKPIAVVDPFDSPPARPQVKPAAQSKPAGGPRPLNIPKPAPRPQFPDQGQ